MNVYEYVEETVKKNKKKTLEDKNRNILKNVTAE